MSVGIEDSDATKKYRTKNIVWKEALYRMWDDIGTEGLENMKIVDMHCDTLDRLLSLE